MDDSINLHPILDYPGLSLLGRNVLNLNGQAIPLLSGEVQFFRMDPEAWEPALQQVKSLELPMVATYLSWRRFSTGPGQYDLTGATNPRLDLPRFLDLCRKYDLWITLKPGPWICAEETNGGYPDWLVSDPDLQVLDADDRPVAGYMGPFTSPIPSYLHPKYQAAVDGWLQAVNEVIRDYIYPAGPIVLIQLDNEPCYTFHDRMFESDYNPANLACYRQWIEAKYQNLPALNATHGKNYSGFDQVDAPRQLNLQTTAHLHSLFDWVEFKEWVLSRHVASIGEKHLKSGLDSALFTINLNEHGQLATPNHWKKLEQVSGLAGYDYYPNMPMQYPDFVKVTQAVNYSRTVLKAAWSPEIMCGIWDFSGQEHEATHLSAEDFEYLYFTCLAYGLKGMNFYMLADRDNWVGSPLTETGARAEASAAVEAVMRFFENFPTFPSMDREQPIGVLFYQPYARQAFLAGGERDVVDGLDLSEPDTLFHTAYSMLTSANLDPCICDLDNNPESLDGVRLLVVPGGTWMDRRTQARLRTWVEAGGHLVFLSQPPRLDETFSPVEIFPIRCENLGSGRTVWQPVEGLLAGLEPILTTLDLIPFVRPDQGSLLTVVQSGADCELLFVINTTAEEQSTKLRFRDLPAGRLVATQMNEQEILIEKGMASVTLPRRSVKIYQLYR